MKFIKIFKKYFLLDKIIIVVAIISCLYGVSIQQYRHYDVNDTRGLDDTISYIEMSKGNYNVSPIHKYRFIIPEIVRQVENSLNLLNNFFNLGNHNHNLLAFYITNYIIMFFCALLLYNILKVHNFSSTISLLGIIIFLTSRTTVYIASVPLVDSIFILGICLIYFLMIKNRFILLSIISPLIILTKETIVPFMFLAVYYKRKLNIFYLISLIISIVFVFFSRYLIDEFTFQKVDNLNCTEKLQGCILHPNNNETIFEVIYRLATTKNNPNLGVISVFLNLFTIKGIISFGHSFLFFIPIAFYGFWLNIKNNSNIPNITLLLIFFISLGLAILSGNTGRLMFSAFLPIIIYSCLVLETVLNKK